MTWPSGGESRCQKTAPWHYFAVPLDESRYDSRFSGDVSSIGRVVAKVNSFRLFANDKKRSVEDRRFALRFIGHCNADLGRLWGSTAGQSSLSWSLQLLAS
jgi:hypothetical protein